MRAPRPSSLDPRADYISTILELSRNASSFTPRLQTSLIVIGSIIWQDPYIDILWIETSTSHSARICCIQQAVRLVTKSFWFQLEVWSEESLYSQLLNNCKAEAEEKEEEKWILTNMMMDKVLPNKWDSG